MKEMGEVFFSLLTLNNLLYMNIGLLGGIVVGALPGLTATMAVALLVPMTYGLDATTGILMLLGVYCGGTYGGSITAILINTPGTPAAAATAWDGHVLAKKGRAGEALEMALVASVFGGLFSTLVLMFVAPQIAKLALKFGPAEYFALAVFGLTIIASVSKSLVKGLIMGILGILATCIGVDPVSGIERLTFGNLRLTSGIQLIPALIGLFAITEILNKAKNSQEAAGTLEAYKKVTLKLKTILQYWKILIKSSCIGTFIGAVPGTGAAIASFISYNEAKRASKEPELFGNGSLEGVCASECGNNAVTGATLIPLLTLGIPGDAITAVLIGALTMQGLAPGPQLFVDHKEYVYGIMLGLILVNIFMYFQGHFLLKFFVNITKVPEVVMVPILLVLCTVGAYAAKNAVFDAGVMVIFGIMGYFLKKLDFPLTPMVIGIVLGSMAEKNYRRALMISNGSASIFLQKPIALFFLILAAAMLLMPIIRNRKAKKV